MNDTHLLLPALVSRSRLWLGTPWAANSCQPGPRGGVACHLLPRAVYIGAGWLPEEFPSIEGSALAGRHQGEGIIEAWVDARPEFRRRPAGEPPQPGDLLGFKLQRVVDHLGVMLVGRQFIHVLQRKNTTLDLLDDPTWSRRLAVAWEVRRA